ncbi:hypothetical protein O9Z70_10680 [Devosia sp. YIM 151766]|uniref:hypothetical protein n=1 Tax=Devosia sp. YIM 151766 TaxID=3017325 RepID=UPI00255C675F|nr:hypothetical protein [Devosia sp. YIM 151766]WIY51945.1 hypothetical protein O9Z70_10680 [Devosia sp. YIM 151766]
MQKRGRQAARSGATPAAEAQQMVNQHSFLLRRHDLLAGRTVLIVETEIIIALNMRAILQNLGAGPVVMMTSPQEFHRRRTSWDDVVLAILEMDSRRPDQLHLVREALGSSVPVLGLTADSQLQSAMPEFSGMAILVKPVPDDALAVAVLHLLHGPGDQNE